MKTELKNRTLWYDGISEIDAAAAAELILLGMGPHEFIVNQPDEEVDLFNSLSEVKIPQTHSGKVDLQHDWIVPLRYLELDIESYCTEKLLEYANKKSIKDLTRYQERLKLEIEEISSRELENIVRCVIFALDRMKQTASIWGVGRGSSCASLVFFLIGLHCVDPVLYGISHLEFFHD
jgi:DNA polymerase III alpha subunit